MLSSTDIQPTVVDGCSLSAAALVAGAPTSATTALSRKAAVATALSCNVAATTALSWEAAAAIMQSQDGAVAAALSREAATMPAPNSDSPVPVALGEHSPSPKFEELSQGVIPNKMLSQGTTTTAAPISVSPTVPDVGLHSPPKFMAAAAPAAWMQECAAESTSLNANSKALMALSC